MMSALGAVDDGWLIFCSSKIFSKLTPYPHFVEHKHQVLGGGVARSARRKRTAAQPVKRIRMPMFRVYVPQTTSADSVSSPLF